MKDLILGILTIVGYIVTIVGSGCISYSIVGPKSVFGYFIFFALWGIILSVLQMIMAFIIGYVSEKLDDNKKN